MSTEPPAKAIKPFDAHADRYARNLRSLTTDEIARLHDARVLVAGCGGLGGHVIECLARTGVGAIVVIDCDAFEETNLNRQLLATEDTLGKSKARAARERIARVNPDVSIIDKTIALDEGNVSDLIAGADCVIDALDNAHARFLLARAANETGIPVVYGAVAGWYGQVCTIFPGDAAFPVVYGDSNGESAHLKEGILAPTAACTAAFQASEAVKVLLGKTGLIRNRLLMIDMLFGSCDDMDITG